MKKTYFVLIAFFFVAVANAQWTTNTKKNTPVAYTGSSDIQCANTNDGRTWIAFYSLQGNNYNMRAQLLDANGNRLFGDSGILASNLKSGSATFVFNVCVDADNDLIIAFQYQQGSNYICTMQKVTTSGNLPWGAAGVNLGPGLSPYPVALSTNEIAVAWSNNNAIDYQKVNANGITAWSPYKEFKGNNNASVSRPQVVANTNGNFAIIFQQTVSFPFYTNLYEQRFSNDGIGLLTSAVKLTSIVTASYRYYEVLADKDTTYIGYYGNPTGSNRFDAYVQKMLPDGSLPWGSPGAHFADYSSIADPQEQTIHIAHAENARDVWAVCTFTNTDQTESGIFAQKFNLADGSKQLGTLSKEVVPINKRLTSLAFSRLSLCGNMPVFVFTDNTNKLYATKLNSNGGLAWNNNAVVIGGSANAKGRYCFTSVYQQQAVAVWQEDKGKGDAPYAQNITCSGSTGIAMITATSISENLLAVNGISKISLEQIFPNPVKNTLQVNLNSKINAPIKISVTNNAGKLLMQRIANVSEGNNTLQIDCSLLPAGIYYLEISSSEVQKIKSKFIK